MTLYEFYNNYFLVNLNDYDNIGIDLEISKILFYFLVSLIILAITISYRRAAMISIIKRLLQQESFDEGSAKTLAELDIDNFGTRLALSLKGCLSRIVMRVGEKKYTRDEIRALKKSDSFKKEKINYNEAKLYLNPDSLSKAQKIVDIPTPSIINTLLFCVFLIAIYIYIVLIIPELLTFINNSLA